MLGDEIYTTVDEVGILHLHINSFNELSIVEKALNLGEKFSHIYTYRGDAINYVVADELKVYFMNDRLLDSQTAGVYSIVDEDSVEEGSSAMEGCFIATAAYGSYFERHVKVLREFRDTYLMHNELGRIFVDIYYHYSPAIAKSIVDNEILKGIVRFLLTPVVFFISYPLLFLIFIGASLLLLFRRRQLQSIQKIGTLS